MTDPEITMGQRPDGTPWVLGVNFGADVRVDAYGKLMDKKRPIDPADARARAAALLAAAEWVESGRSEQIEREGAGR